MRKGSVYLQFVDASGKEKERERNQFYNRYYSCSNLLNIMFNESFQEQHAKILRRFGIFSFLGLKFVFVNLFNNYVRKYLEPT